MIPKKWTVTFRDVAGSALHVPIYDAETEDEAVRLARLEALQHFSAQEVNSAITIQIRQGHDGLDIANLEDRFGSSKDREVR